MTKNTNCEELLKECHPTNKYEQEQQHWKQIPGAGRIDFYCCPTVLLKMPSPQQIIKTHEKKKNSWLICENTE